MNSGINATLARPYVTAAFELALKQKDLVAWDEMLTTAALISENAQVAKLLKNPNMSKQQLTELFCDLLAPLCNDERTNFIRLVAENNRLDILSDISSLFKEAKALEEKMITVEAVSATSLDENNQQKLADALKKRLNQKVELHVTVDPNIIGGIILRMGDAVIDGSVRGKLMRLSEYI